MTHRSFTAKDAALTINYIGFVFRTLVGEGYQAQALLQETGLTEQDFTNPDFRCSFEQHKVFVSNAIRETQDPHLGPKMGARFNPINIGLPASAAMSSDIFATALNTLKQFISLNFSIVALDFHQEDEQLILQWQSAVDVSDIEYFVMGSCVAVTENLLTLLLGEKVVINRAELAMPAPPQWESFKSSINFDVHFDAPFNRLLLPSHYLDKPLAGTDPLVHQHMLRLCEKQLADSFYDEGIEAQVSRYIGRCHYHSVPIEQTALELGLSERSLRRQLNQSGSSYKKVVDEVRASRAKELLSISGLPISTIAYDLGFSDPSNFARTFKRWEAMSPQEFREVRASASP